MDPFADFGIEPKDVITGYISGVISVLIIPVQLIVLKALFSHKDLWNNSSYRLLFRLILLEVLQTSSLILTSIFTIYPYLAYIDVLRKACSVMLSIFFLMNFVLMYELSILRILVVCKKCLPDKLPLPILLFETLCLLIVLGLSVPAYINESLCFEGGDWFYNEEEDVFARIINTAEVFFCIPLLLVTYCAYLILIAVVYGKRKRFSENFSSKHELILFLQTTFVIVYYIFLIYDWHFIDTPETHKYLGYSSEVFSAVMWGTAYYWNSLILLIFNRTVRNHIFSIKKKTTVIVSTL